MTDFPDWQDPVGIADQIALTGVGLLRFEKSVASGVTSALTAGSSAAIGPFSLVSTSYDLAVTLTASALTATCNGQIVLKWSDVNGTLLSQKTFSVVASTGGHKISVTGPIRGGQLTITFINSTASLANITFTYDVIASSRLASNDLCRTITTVGTGPPNNFTWSGTGNMDSGVLGNANPGIAAGANTSRGLDMYNGPVAIQGLTPAANNTLEMQVFVFDGTIAVNSQLVFDDFSDGHGVINNNFILPMSQCWILITNHDAATRTVQFCVTTQEPNVN